MKKIRSCLTCKYMKPADWEEVPEKETKDTKILNTGTVTICYHKYSKGAYTTTEMVFEGICGRALTLWEQR